jgi:MFS family permease
MAHRGSSTPFICARQPIFYGWLVVAAASLIMFTGTGTMFSFGVFLKPIQHEFGWPRAVVSATFAMNWAALALSSFIFGALSDRSTRHVALTGSLVFGLGLFLAARVTTLWQLYLTFGVLPGLATGCFYVPLVSLATRWFTTRRGLAVGIVSGGAGFGMVLVPRLADFLMALYGLRATLTILSLMGVAVMVPAAFLLRTSPADLGLQPYGAEPGQAEPRPGLADRTPTGRWQYLISLPFPLIALTHVLCCVAHSGPQYHMIAFITDSGLARTTAAAVFSTWACAGVGGRLVTGLIADRIGVRPTLMVMLAGQGLTILLYVAASSLWSFYTFGVLFGFIYGAVMPLYALLLREYYPEQVIGKVYGSVFGISALGMGTGSFLGGVIFDAFGSYTMLFVLSAMVGGAALIMVTLLPPLAVWGAEPLEG